MPYGAMKTFIQDNIAYVAKQKAVRARAIRQWYDAWRRSLVHMEVAAVADKHAPVTAQNPKGFLKSRAPVAMTARRSAPVAGAHPKAYCVRETLYEWFTGIRYAIDCRCLRRTAVVVRNNWPDFLVPTSGSRCSSSSKTMPTHAY